MFIGDHEENFVLESVQPNGAGFGERMISRKGDYEIRGADAMLFEAFGFSLKGQSDKANIQTSGRQRFALFRGGEVEKINGDGRIESAKLLQCVRHGGMKEAPDVADVEALLLRGACALHRAIGLLKNRFCFREEGFTTWRESDFAVIALKERDAEFLFELLDLAAESGLGDMESGRSPGEIEFTGHGSEVAELPQFHARSPYRIGMTARAKKYWRRHREKR